MQVPAANINAQRELLRARAEAGQMHARADRAEQRLHTAEREFTTANNNASRADTKVSLTQTAQAFSKIPEVVNTTLNRLSDNLTSEKQVDQTPKTGQKIDILV